MHIRESLVAAVLFLKHLNDNYFLNLCLLQLLLRVRSYFHNPSIHYNLTQDLMINDQNRILLIVMVAVGGVIMKIFSEKRDSRSHLHYH